MIASRHARKILLGAALGVLGVLGAMPVQALAQDKPNVRILTGPAGGTYYIMGAVVADALYRTGSVSAATSEASSGSLENARRIGSGAVQFGMMDVAWARRSLAGSKPFTQKIELRTAMPLFVAPMFFVTMADSPIKTFDDLRGKRIAVGPKGSGMENHGRQVLAGLGWTFDNIKPVYLAFQPGGNAMREGKVDAQLQCCIPNGGFTELTTLARVRLVGWKPGQLDKVVNSTPDYNKTMVRKGAFRGVEEDTATIALFNGVMTSDKVDNKTVYLLAKTMIEKLKDMTAKTAQFGTLDDVFAEARAKGVKALEVGAPLHPGAILALKEAGILK